MTNDQLSRAVAEHEGWTLVNGLPTYTGSDVSKRGTVCQKGAYGYGWPPYATSWTLTGPLAEKYEIHVGTNFGGGWVAGVGDNWLKHADTPLRAICLAILEVNNE